MICTLYNSGDCDKAFKADEINRETYDQENSKDPFYDAGGIIKAEDIKYKIKEGESVDYSHP